MSQLIQTVKNLNSPSTKLKADLGNNASTRIIQSTLKKKGFNWRKMCKKPLLTEKHKDTRQKLFTGEKKFNLDGPDFCNYYWHHLCTDTKIQPRRKVGDGGIMIWGGVC